MESIHRFIELCLSYVHLHPQLGEVFAFTVAFLESLPIAGTIIPGSITMTAVGAMVGTGALPAGLTLMWAAIGALVGDSLGFICGRLFKENIESVWPFRKHPKLLQRSQAFFDKHGGKSIIIGRFVGPARSTVPLVAGMLKMRWRNFVAAAIPSAVLWAIVYTIPGILLGAVSIELPPQKMTESLVVGVAIIFLLWLLIWLLQMSFRWLLERFNASTDQLWRILKQRRNNSRLIHWLCNQQDPDNHHQLARLVSCTVAIMLFSLSYILAALHTAYVDINQPLFHFVQSFRGVHLDSIMIMLTFLGKPVVVLVTALLIAVLLWINRQRRAACHLAALVLTTAAAVTVFKYLAYSPRPFGFNDYDPSSSLPSGHSTMSLAVYGFLALLCNDTIKKLYHWITYLLTAIIVVLIFFSRLYLGMHWMTDIITSCFLGSSLLLLAVISYRRFPNADSCLQLSLSRYLLLVIPCVVLPWAVYAASHYRKAVYQHTPIHITYQSTVNQWWQHPLVHVGLYRDNRFGHAVAPLNIQWMGSLKQVTHSLTKLGWHVIPMQQHSRHNLNSFARKHLKYHIPLLPVLYHRHKPIIIASKLDGNKTLLLYFWRSNLTFKDSRTPLLVGSLSLHQLHHADQYYIALLPYLHINAWVKSSKVVALQPKNIPQLLHHSNWDQQLLLCRS